MNSSLYTYIQVFPVTITNFIWVFITLLLFLSYVSNYAFHDSNPVGKVLKFFIVYGKSKPYQQKFDLPKRFYTHFYIFASLWNSASFFTMVGLCFGFINKNWIAELFQLNDSAQPHGDQLSVFLVMSVITYHSFKRLYECLFVSVFSSKAKINAVQYIWGFMYYLCLPPTLITECLKLEHLPFGHFQLRHFIGICGFVIASFIQHQSHIIFANLRKTGRIKKDSHGIPTGGLFHLVSCPHYFAEVLVYVSTLVIIEQQCHSWWLVLTYNLVAHANMAMGAHQWYKQNFSNYPEKRKAFIPFLL